MEPRWAAALLVMVLAVGAGMWWGRGVTESERPPVVQAALSIDEEVAGDPVPPASMSVHVSGWVVSPGIVEVPAGARSADAIAAAGGARVGARLDAINLAQPLDDGQQLVVPGPATSGPTAIDGGAGSDGRVRLNSATIAELETLPGVGPVLAERIAAHRDSHGGFKTVEDLLDVAGIGEAKLAAIRDHVTLP